MTCTKNYKANLTAIKKPIIVIVFFLVFGYLSLWLKSYSNLSEASFMVLITLSTILSILLPNMNQLKSFSIAKGELVLQEIKETETSVKALAEATLNVMKVADEKYFELGGDDYKDIDKRFKESISKLETLTSTKRVG
ncbi:hypothetical protein [Psychromonas aquatilis]|uniref:Uncharacterized protein n=1 Tax=Psychromonas aquatilis TaxID=2005072 RepID=A0ABU9GST3_9GAMM